MIDLVFRNTTAHKMYREPFFRNILIHATRTVKLKYNTIHISVNLVGIHKIRTLNRKYLKNNAATDVLSFPLGDKFPKRYNEITLGDIFICLPYIVQHAKEKKLTVRTYLAQAAVHGFLHLIGHDHERSVHEKRTMDSLETQILNKL